MSAERSSHVRARTRRPFGVNVFFPTRLAADEAAVGEYAARLAGEAERYGVPCGEAHWSDDEWEGKLELIAREQPAVASFTFGYPDRSIVARLQGSGIAVWCTVTAPTEARAAAAAGVDALVVQGAEAGGHQGSFDDTDAAPVGLLALLQLVRERDRSAACGRRRDRQRRGSRRRHCGGRVGRSDRELSDADPGGRNQRAAPGSIRW